MLGRRKKQHPGRNCGERNAPERSNTSSGEWRLSPDMSRSYGRSDTGICIASTRMRCSFSKELWLDLVWNIMNESLKEIG